MTGWHVARWTGATAIAAVILQLVGGVVLAAGGLPPKGESATVSYLHNSGALLQTSLLLFLVGFVVFLVFFAGLRALIIEADAQAEFLATTVFGLGLATVILGFISLGLFEAAAAAAVSHPDTAAVMAIYVSAGVIAGAPSAVTFAGFLGVSGRRSRAASCCRGGPSG